MHVNLEEKKKIQTDDRYFFFLLSLESKPFTSSRTKAKIEDIDMDNSLKRKEADLKLGAALSQDFNQEK